MELGQRGLTCDDNGLAAHVILSEVELIWLRSQTKLAQDGKDYGRAHDPPQGKGPVPDPVQGSQHLPVSSCGGGAAVRTWVW